jgi:hypothetical protein
VRFLRQEEATGRVISAWGTLDTLDADVLRHRTVEAELLGRRAEPIAPDLARAWRSITRALDLAGPRSRPRAGAA